MGLLLNPEVWVAFLTLLALEIVLGIDNIVFISILVDKLPEQRQSLARRLGLGLALLMRILLLLSLSWVIGLTALLFTVLGREISRRDFILIFGKCVLPTTYPRYRNFVLDYSRVYRAQPSTNRKHIATTCPERFRTRDRAMVL